MIIYAIKIEDIKIASILNFIKYICAPNSKTEIHLSIRGPYSRRLPADKIEKLNEVIKDANINVNEVGNFFLYGQNTVFLKCISSAIQKVWDKSNYGYNPHLTLYDGDDQHFATQLFDLLTKIKINISFNSSGLIMYDTNKLTPSTLLTIGINNQIINDIIGYDWKSINLNECTVIEKFSLIKTCILGLPQFNPSI